MSLEYASATCDLYGKTCFHLLIQETELRPVVRPGYCTNMTSPTWTPPSEPNPHDILHAAVDDTSSGAYEQALAKFLWFHGNALRYDPALSGVRLSFALSYWLNLAGDYPPARDAFIRTRDQAENAFKSEGPQFELFLDLATLNARLGDELRTAELFLELARRDQSDASHLYNIAEPHLIAAGRFHECSRFLDAEARLRNATELYTFDKQEEEEMADTRIPKLARKLFVQNVSTLVALLVLNDRLSEARGVYARSLAIIDDEESRLVMDAAMTGHLSDT